MSDVVVGSISKITVENWHADVDIAVKPDVVVPANGVASVGQTSLLGSLHLAIDPPIGQQAEGRTPAGCNHRTQRHLDVPLYGTDVVVAVGRRQRGGLGQFTDIIKTFNVVLAGRQPQIRELLTRLDNFVGVLQEQQANIVASVRELNRFAGTLAVNHDVVDRALKRIPAAISILIRQRPRLTAALEKLGSFSRARRPRWSVHTKGDLVRDLTNLEPTIRSLADVGPDLVGAAVAAATLPYTQNVIDRGVRGDYMNLFATFDISIPRLKRSLFLGSRWGQEDDPEPPAPGDPHHLRYGYAPLPAEVADHLPDGFTASPAPLPAGAPTTVPAVGTPKLGGIVSAAALFPISPPGVLPADLAPLDQADADAQSSCAHPAHHFQHRLGYRHPCHNLGVHARNPPCWALAA